jgi:hypothetical protein
VVSGKGYFLCYLKQQRNCTDSMVPDDFSLSQLFYLFIYLFFGCMCWLNVFYPTLIILLDNMS